jgi:hypothetical protein
MYAGTARREPFMTDHDNQGIQVATERFERRLAEENAKLRVDMATEFGKVRVEMASEFGKVRSDMHEGFGGLRAEMIARNAELLKWGLIFGATQSAALAAVIVALR